MFPPRGLQALFRRTAIDSYQQVTGEPVSKSMYKTHCSCDEQR